MDITRCCSGEAYQKIDNAIICLNYNCDNYLGATITDSKSRTYLFLVPIVLSLLLLPLNKQLNSEFELPTTRIDSNIPDLNNENLKAELSKLDILCPEHVLAQVKLESGNLKSFLYKKTNNLIGMRFPYKRPTTAIGLYLPDKDSLVFGNQKQLLKFRTNNTYAVYRNWVDCIQDYKYWQESTFNVTKRYLDFLKNNYAEDTLYIKKLIQLSGLAKKADKSI